MATNFSITNSEPWTYLDELRNPVNGFRVTFVLTAYGEAHSVNVRTLDAATVKKAITVIADQRDALAKL